jgi:hypothetical protein
MGFAVSNGRFVFLAQDAVAEYPVASFYMVDSSGYETLFTGGTSVSNQCAGALDAEYAAPGALNQESLSSNGLLAFGAEVLPATFPNGKGPCSWAQGSYIHDPVGYFVLDTTHRLIPTETEITLSPAQPIAWGQKPELKIKVMPAVGAHNPKDLVPTGVVSVWFTNPEYFGDQQPHAPSAELNADGEATVSLGALEQGTYTYVVSYGGDTNFASSASPNLVFPLHVTTPTFSIKGGTYKTTQSVYITDTTPAATIHYTINGSTPNKSSPVFSTALTVSKTTTIKAIAFATGDQASAVASATYTIKK